MIWWKWSKSISLSISLNEASLLYDKKFDIDLCQPVGGCERLETHGITKSGIYSHRVKKSGCYYFLVMNESKPFLVTLVATTAQRDHTVALTDNECLPNIINIHPEDRVWFSWENTKRPQNVRYGIMNLYNSRNQLPT